MPVDRFNRNINYLRISLTDMCNLRCVYCMPENMNFRPDEELMTNDEVIRLVKIFSGIGFDKIRYTGGEPTLRDGLVDIVRQSAALPGIKQVAMTTNAILLKHLAAPLVDAGLKRVNISVDTLNPERFRKLTRWGNLNDVWRGLHAAEKAGLEIKLNAVVVRGFNDDKDVTELAQLTIDKPWQVRFIELMPFGSVSDFQQSHVVKEDELRDMISDKVGPLELMHQGRLDGEARMYRLPNARGAVGFISSVSNPFCAGCNRARLTADGKLRLCLLRDKELDLMPFLRAGADDEEIKTLVEDSIWYKPWGHGLASQEFPKKRVMSEIGG